MTSCSTGEGTYPFDGLWKGVGHQGNEPKRETERERRTHVISQATEAVSAALHKRPKYFKATDKNTGKTLWDKRM